MASAHALIVEPDDGRTLVLQALNAATKSIDLTIYELSDPQIISALESAQARKVAVRVLYNEDSFTSRMQQTDITPVVQKLTQTGIQCGGVNPRPHCHLGIPRPQRPADLAECRLAGRFR